METKELYENQNYDPWWQSNRFKSTAEEKRTHTDIITTLTQLGFNISHGEVTFNAIELDTEYNYDSCAGKLVEKVFNGKLKLWTMEPQMIYGDGKVMTRLVIFLEDWLEAKKIFKPLLKNISHQYAFCYGL